MARDLNSLGPLSSAGVSWLACDRLWNLAIYTVKLISAVTEMPSAENCCTLTAR